MLLTKKKMRRFNDETNSSVKTKSARKLSESRCIDLRSDMNKMYLLFQLQISFPQQNNDEKRFYFLLNM